MARSWQGTNVVAPTDFLLFSLDGGVSDSGMTLGAPWDAVTFPARAHEPYQVWVSVVLKGDQSGGYAFAGSFAFGYINVRLPLIFTELH